LGDVDVWGVERRFTLDAEGSFGAPTESFDCEWGIDEAGRRGGGGVDGDVKEKVEEFCCA